MNIANLYRRIKQILDDSNVALTNKGLNAVSDICKIPAEIEKLGIINRLPYVLNKKIIEITEDDLRDAISIGERAFYGCTSLTDINIPDSVTSIGSSAFQSCTSLTDINIPDSVTSIGSSAFDYCRSLTDIYLNPTTPPSLSNTSAVPDHTTIHVPIGSGEAYKSATNWSYHSDRIIEDIVAE